MGQQSFTLKWTAIGGDMLLEIPRNHLVIEIFEFNHNDIILHEMFVFST